MSNSFPNSLENEEGEQVQHSAEAIAWSWLSAVGTPTSVASVSVFDMSSDGDDDVTATVMPSGTETISGNTITLKPLTALTAGRRYRIVLDYATAEQSSVVGVIRIYCPL